MTGPGKAGSSDFTPLKAVVVHWPVNDDDHAVSAANFCAAPSRIGR